MTFLQNLNKKFLFAIITIAIIVLSVNNKALANADLDRNVDFAVNNLEQNVNFTVESDRVLTREDVKNSIVNNYSTNLNTLVNLKEYTYDVKPAGGNNYTVEINFEYNITKEDAKKVDEFVSNWVVENTSGPMNDYAKINKVYDFYHNFFTYDEGAEIFTNGVSKHSPVALLQNGKGVCSAYTILFDEMMEEMGIGSEMVVGTYNGGSHSWNMVELNGKWYHIDTIYSQYNYNNEKSRDGFLKSAKNIGAGYAFNESAYPVASANYFN